MLSLFRKTLLIGLLILVGLTIWLSHLRADDALLIMFWSTRTGSRDIHLTSKNGNEIWQVTDSRRPDQSYPTPFKYLGWDSKTGCLTVQYEKKQFCINNFSSQSSCRYWRDLNDRFVYTGQSYSDWFLFSAEALGIFRAHPDGTELMQLSEHYSTSLIYMCSEQQILFYNDGWFIVSIDGTGEHFIDDTLTAPRHLTLSPDLEWVSARISYQGFLNQRPQYIYKVINRETSQFRYINVFSHKFPIWSPDNRYLLYEGEDGFYSLDTRNLTDHLAFSLEMPVYEEIHEESRYRHFEYEWSPDNQYLLIEVQTELYVLKPDGTEAAHLTDSLQANYLQISTHQEFADYFKNMHWSPDAKWILLQAEIPYTTADIFRVRRDGSGLTNITSNPNWDVNPYWMPFKGRNWRPVYLLTGSVVGIAGLMLGTAARRRIQTWMVWRT